MKNINLGATFLFLSILCSIKIEQLLFLKFLKILAFFDSYFWPFNKTREKIIAIFVISAIMASIWNDFIKFRWHDENLTYVSLIRSLSFFVKSVFCCLSITVLRKWGHSNKSAVHRVEGVWTIHGYDLCLSEILFQWIYLCRCIWWYELEN